MAEFPALPLFTDAYLGDTRHLSTVQHGAYCLMLMTAWRSSDCALPDEDIMLARITGLDRRAWLKNKHVLLSFWQLSAEGKWTQKRLLDERIYVEQLRNKNSQAGKASALKRKNRGSTNVQPKANKTATPTPTPIQTELEAKASTLSAPCKMPFTKIPEEWKKAAMEEKGWSENVTLDIWQAFYEYWRNGKGKGTVRENWAATWRNWYRKENYTPPKGVYNANTQGNAPYSTQPGKSERARAAILKSAQDLGYAD